MPRDLVVKLYKFEELDERAKDKVRKRFGQEWPDYEWWGSVEVDAKACLAMCGFHLTDISFRGHGPFDVRLNGTWYASDVNAEALKKHAPVDDKLHEIADMAQLIKNDCLLNEQEMPSAKLLHVGRVSDVEVFDAEDEIETRVSAMIDEACWWVGSQLMKEYEYLTSEEYIDETIIMNEYEFTEDGEQWHSALRI